ncbi:sigma-70 family RNA polymerase sigma factor [Tepidibacillus infernus]|uniref:HTH luxR-type domain-containing protein n=1 Tax=Tepidibacillus decaturensis TaxID=1413211 RepID=A0A135L4K3_9BACI|nr:sigma-70 family RNA polymerase sigma factor [Tepidibacillus decaturensis]KXG43938.1 hypothetical protein U473_07905 [Tepidibacillus decaturensis]
MNKKIEQAQQGNQQAMEELIQQYQPLLISFAKRKYVNHSFEETLQEGQLAFIIAVQHFDPTYGIFFGSFAKQRIWRHLTSLLRKEKKWQETILVDGWKEDYNAILSTTEDLDFRIWKEQAESILSEKEKQFFDLFWIKGFTVAEIAEQMNVSTNTVKTWKKRAIKKLREDLLSPNHPPTGTI